MNRGATYLQMGKYNLAIEDFSEIIKRDPNSSDAYNNRGLAYHMSGKKEKACNDIRKGCDLGNCVALETAKKKKLCQ